MNKRSSLATLILLSLFVTALGQTPKQTSAQQSDQDDVVRISTNLVQVDAVVTDKNGRPVTDLTAEDFEITEDGRSQKVTNLSYISAEKPVTQPVRPPATVADKNIPAPSVPLRPEQVRRTIALVVDDLGLSFESTVYVRRALKKFVDEEMQPGDLVAIIRTGGGVGALQQFTTDKRQLYAAIERVRWNMTGRGGMSAFSPITASDDPSFGSSSSRKSSPSLKDDSASIGRANRGKNEDSNPANDLDEFRSDIFAVGTLGALNYIVRGLREMPGRKSVLLISDGFSLFDKDLESRRILDSLQRLTDLANRASVVIYTMDARGLQTMGLTAADNVQNLTPEQVETRLSGRRNELFNTQTGLIYLAKQTGGFNVRNSNDLSAGIRRVMEDQSGYYLIGYRPDESTFDPRTGQRRFHKISVKVKRPGLQVRSRSGFYGITDERAVPVRRTRDEQLIGALVSPFNSNGVNLRLTSLFGNDPRMGSFVRSLLYIDASQLTFTEEDGGWHKATMDVVAVTFGDNGQVIDQINRTQSMRLRGETYQNILKHGLVYFLNVPIKKAGAYQLRVAVRDATSEQVGSASQFIEVPDMGKKRLTVSGIIVNGYEPKAAGSEPRAAQAASAGAGSEGTQEELDPQAGAAVRRFRQGMIMNYGYVIYNAQLDKATRRPQLQTQIRIFREGQPVFNGSLKPLDAGGQPDLARLVAGGGVKLGSDMIPGEYVLQVVVTDLLAKDNRRTATQWIDFEIVK